MNRTPTGGAAEPPSPSPEKSDDGDPGSAVPPPRTGLEELPRRVRGASGAVSGSGREEEPVDADTLNRLLTGLREI
jgi:hypothetical protein